MTTLAPPPHAPDPAVEAMILRRRHTSTVALLAHPDNALRQATHTASERDALLALDEDRENETTRTMGQLGAGIGLSRAAITALVDRLERRHLVHRVSDTEDRRRTVIIIAKKGEALVASGLRFRPTRTATEARDA